MIAALLEVKIVEGKIQMPKQKQNPEMPKQKQNPEIADGFWCSPSITKMDYGGEYIEYYN